MEWIGLLSSAFGLLLFILKKCNEDAQVRKTVTKAQRVIREGEAEAARFAEEVAKGEVDKASIDINRVLSDLDALGLLSKRGTKKPTP